MKVAGSFAFALLGGCLIVAPQCAQAGRAAGSAALIIGKLPVGTRAIALSGAYAAVAGEPAAVYWNPAGLARIGRTRVEALHVEQGQQIRMENILVAQPMLYGGTLGLAGSFLSQPPLELTREDAAGNFVETQETFSAYEFKGAAGYGQDLSRLAPVPALGKLWSRGAVGGTLTVLGEGIAGTRSYSVSADLGYLYEDTNAGRSFGIVARQLGAKVRGRPLPVTAQVGFAQVIRSWLMTFDLLTAADDTFRIRSGAEWVFLTGSGDITLRGGWQHSLASTVIAPFSTGLGYRFQLPGRFEFTVEYAFVPVQQFQDLHAVSVQVGL